MAFKVLCVDHVGVAVNDLALIKKQMKDLLNLFCFFRNRETRDFSICYIDEI